VLRLETTAINRLDLAVPDAFGERPADGRPIDPTGPAGRLATWDARGIVAALRTDGVPAAVSHHAGTHLCNAALYSALGAMEAERLTGACGFLHLPCLPAQVARLQREAPADGQKAPLAERSLPSMAFELQLAALRLVLDHMARAAESAPASAT
jgi:pyroglutamyl-peptidase